MKYLTRGLQNGVHGFTLLMLATSISLADTADFSPARDNTLYERPTGDVSNGSGVSLFFGQTGPNNNNLLRRAIMAFDLSSIPAGSTIEDASLSITVNMTPPTPTGFNATLHRVTNNWGEGNSNAPGVGGVGAPAEPGDATWIHQFFDTQPWNQAGGDFDAQASSTTVIGSGNGVFTFNATPSMLADIQTWVNQPLVNFGWIILGEEGNAQNARRIASRENSTGAPVLSIEFTPAPPLPPAQSVPTLTPTGLILLIGGFMLIVLMTLRGRKRSS